MHRIRPILESTMERVVPTNTERQSRDPCDRTFVSYVDKSDHKGMKAWNVQEFDIDENFDVGGSSTHRPRGMQVLKNNGSGNRTGTASLLLPRMSILYLLYLCSINSGDARLYLVGSTDIGTILMARISPCRLNNHPIAAITSRRNPMIKRQCSRSYFVLHRKTKRYQ